MPTDIWYPSTSIVQPQFATQYALGYFRNFKDNIFETSVEVYYKKMDNQIEYKDGVSPGDNPNNSDYNFTFGTGQSYGLELFIKKRIGKTTGWIGYTLSKTTEVFPDINNGLEFPAKYDRRHDLSITATHELNDKWSISGIFVFATGNALTVVEGRYFIDGRVVYQYGPRDGFRMPPYDRLDLSATYEPHKNKRWHSSWTFSIYNVYNRHNPYFIYFDETGNLVNGLTVKAMQVSLFPILPSVTWNFKF
jgi:hypothetical protein